MVEISKKRGNKSKYRFKIGKSFFIIFLCIWSDVEGDEMLEKIVEFLSERNSLSASIEFVHLCYLLQPTSSCVEHALSMVKYSCTEQQSSKLLWCSNIINFKSFSTNLKYLIMAILMKCSSGSRDKDFSWHSRCLFLFLFFFSFFSINLTFYADLLGSSYFTYLKLYSTYSTNPNLPQYAYFVCPSICLCQYETKIWSTFLSF